MLVVLRFLFDEKSLSTKDSLIAVKVIVTLFTISNLYLMISSANEFFANRKALRSSSNNFINVDKALFNDSYNVNKGKLSLWNANNNILKDMQKRRKL